MYGGGWFFAVSDGLNELGIHDGKRLGLICISDKIGGFYNSVDAFATANPEDKISIYWVSPAWKVTLMARYRHNMDPEAAAVYNRDPRAQDSTCIRDALATIVAIDTERERLIQESETDESTDGVKIVAPDSALDA
jgi:hypothetical protein